MRKVTYIIDDVEWFRRDFCKQNLTEEQIDSLIGNWSTFKATYILIGDTQPERYELYVNGEKCSINDHQRVNNYQHGCILNDCYRHFMGQEHGKSSFMEGYLKEDVFGCIEIIEEEVDD